MHLAYPAALGELAGVVTALIFVGRAYTVSAGAVTVASCATVATPSCCSASAREGAEAHHLRPIAAARCRWPYYNIM